MDVYNKLLEDARKKRNEAVAKARQEYAQSVRKIKDLEARLDSKDTIVDPKRKILIDLIAEAIPRDRLFRINEVIDAVQHDNPNRAFHVVSLASQFHRLIRRGDIVRVSRDDAGYVLYAAETYQAPPTEFGMMKTGDVIELILRERGTPTRPSELVVLMQERGYKSTADPQMLLNAVKCTLQRHPQLFRETAGKWSVFL